MDGPVIRHEYAFRPLDVYPNPGNNILNSPTDTLRKPEITAEGVAHIVRAIASHHSVQGCCVAADAKAFVHAIHYLRSELVDLDGRMVRLSHLRSLATPETSAKIIDVVCNALHLVRPEPEPDHHERMLCALLFGDETPQMVATVARRPPGGCAQHRSRPASVIDFSHRCRAARHR